MPYFPHTPESLGLRIGRNDSKKPETTCNGITNSGRPCRRALASPKSSPNHCRESSIASTSRLTITRDSGELEKTDGYCWQHKDQALRHVPSEHDNVMNGNRDGARPRKLFPLREKTSIDTFVQRLGIDATSDSGTTIQNARSQQPTRNPRAPRRTDTTDFAVRQPGHAPFAEQRDFVRADVRPPKPRRNGFWAMLCCMTADETDYVEIVRHKRRVEQTRGPEMAMRPAQSKQYPTMAATSVAPPARVVVPNKVSNLYLPTKVAQRSIPSGPQSTGLLSHIPQHISPQTASNLLAELIKPISPSDEGGYIYIFWLTPQTNAQPEASIAQSLLSPNRPPHERSISDVMSEYSYDDSNEEVKRRSSKDLKQRGQPRTIMLKIGRASNITRRMNQWQRQCGYALNLVRWYPYVPSTPSPHPSPATKPLYPDLTRPPPPTDDRRGDAVRKIACVKRVERLIHLELAQKQVTRRCEACGKDHREWFEVEASQRGVREVDETVRRWVDWAEKGASRH